MHTLLETLDSDGSGVVPQPLPDLPELSVPQLPDKLQAAPVNFPLVPRAVGQVGRHWLLDLQKWFLLIAFVSFETSKLWFTVSHTYMSDLSNNDKIK